MIVILLILVMTMIMMVSTLWMSLLKVGSRPLYE